jgi:pimeloyl-ACP methyl ester carboxylesterase
VIKQTGAKDALLVGFSMGGGEVARYMSRHEGKGVSQAALIASILPFRLKTPDNPGGTDQTVFDETAKAINEDRPLFLSRFFKKFFDGGPGSNPVSEELLEWARSVALQASLKATLGCLKAFPDRPAGVRCAYAHHPRHRRQDGVDRCLQSRRPKASGQH